MARKHPNVEQRGDTFYYRMSLSGIGPVRLVRLSLKTNDVNVAAERAATIRRQLERWRKAVGAREDGLTSDEKASILRATARRMRDLLDVPEAVAEIADPLHGRADHLRGLRALDLIATDLAVNGMSPSWGSLDHFLERFVENGLGEDTATLEMIRSIIEHNTGMPDQLDDLANDALLRLNIERTPVNVALARKQVVLGKIAGIRSRIQDARAPAEQIERALKSLLHDFDFNAPPPPAGEHLPPFATPSRPVVQVAAAPTQMPPPAADPLAAMTIKAIAAAFLQAHPQCDVGQKGSIWTAKTRGQFDSIVELASKHFGQTPLAKFDDLAIATFFRILSRLPVGHHKSERHARMSLEAIAAENIAGTTLAVVTLNRHMQFFRKLLDWAFARMAHPPRVEWKSFIQRDRGAKSARDQRQAFTVQELTDLFAGPLWCGAKSQVRRFDPGSLIIHDAGYYAPLGLVYSGLRREEWCGARTRDIVEVDGIWVIRLTADRQLKNANAVRDVPIAKELIRLQLLDYVRTRQRRGDEFLFPELENATGLYGEGYNRKFWRGHQRAGQIPADRVIHSIRHFVATELSEVGVEHKVVADLLGHGHEGETQGRYTKRARLGRLQDAVNRIPVVTKDLPIRPLRLR